jgi:parallel beta-helix repeat protein
MGVTGWSTNEAICIDSGSSSNYNLVSYNNINNSGYDGIRWAGANTEISYNFINRSCQNAADGAGIYSYRGTGANRIVKYNIVLNTMSQPYGWVYQDWTSGNGIYLDGDGGVSILNNVLAHNQGKGLFINSNQGTTAEYNTAYDNSYGIYVFSEPNVNGLDGRARNHIVEYNTLFSKTADQYSLGVVSINAESDLSLFGTIDYNYYARPINIDNYIFREYSAWGGPNQDINLAEMRSQLGYDAHSTVSSASVSDVNNIRFEYNPTTSNKVISLGSNTYVDAKGTSYSGSVTLLPYTAVVLIKT